MTLMNHSFDKSLDLIELNEAGDFTGDDNTTALDTQGLKRVSWLVNVTALSGAAQSLTLTWQHSPDNVVWVDIAAETALTGAGTKQRVAAENRMRYVRVSWTTGTNAVGTGVVYIQAAK